MFYNFLQKNTTILFFLIFNKILKLNIWRKYTKILIYNSKKKYFFSILNPLFIYLEIFIFFLILFILKNIIIIDY